MRYDQHSLVITDDADVYAPWRAQFGHNVHLFTNLTKRAVTGYWLCQ